MMNSNSPNIKIRAAEISAELGDLHPVLARIYAGRGIKNPNDLSLELSALISDDKLLNADRAAALLADALRQQQRILIIGDYDADGATSTALVVSVLRKMGAKHVDFLVPNRFTYGYGLTPEIVELAATQQPDLLITVDNGIASHAGVAKAKALGMQVLITDHHLPATTLPIADVIVNPNQPDDHFPSKNLAGVGVIFYVLLALRRHLRANNWFSEQAIPEINLAYYLDLVALGTIADVVPLDKNNRVLIQQGIKRIQAGLARPGINALLTVAARSRENLSATDLAFSIAPRLNAAGRLDDMALGIRCLLAEDEASALPLATQLHELNMERRSIEQEMQQEALSFIQRLRLPQQELAPGLCLFDEYWHQGVIGIVAARIKDRFHRPVIAFASANETEVKGSGRSIPGIHLRDVLDQIATAHPELISKFGGHAMAAGLTLKRSDLAKFSECFAETVQGLATPELFTHTLLTDGELAPEDLNLDFAFLLKNAGPFGQHFPEPVFQGEFRLLEQHMIHAKHLKCTVVHEDSAERFQAIAFNIHSRGLPQLQCERVRLVYRLDINVYQGLPSLQLMIEHIEAI